MNPFPREWLWTEGCGQKRCASIKWKIHAGGSDRAQKPSSWRCALVTGHPHNGQHWALPSAHQAPWYEEPDRTQPRRRKATA